MISQARSLPADSFPLPAWALVGILVAITFVAHLPALDGGFIMDDDLLLQNKTVKDPAGLYRIWFTTDAVDYWPVTNSVFWTEWRLWGQTRPGYHVVNLALHITAALLIWAIFSELSILGGFLAALLFAVHPVNVESVAWISQLKTILACVFFLLSIWCYLRADPPSLPSAQRLFREGSGMWYWLSLAMYVLGMLSKASIVGLPLILLAILWWRRGEITKWDLARIAPFLVVTLPLVLVNLWFRNHGKDDVIRAASFLERLAGAGAVPWFYLYKALWPFSLIFIYPEWEIDIGNPLWWLPLLASVAVTVVLWWQRRTLWGRALLFCWIFYWLALAPVLGFADVTYMKWSLVADHYQYIAIISVLGLIAAGISLGIARLSPPAIRAGVAASVALVGFLAFLTWQQSSIYQDAITLNQDTIEKNPTCWRAYNNLAMALHEAGRSDEAIRNYEEAIRARPDFVEAHINLGATLYVTGHPQEGAEQFREALRLNPAYASIYFNLGKDALHRGQPQEAIEFFEQALRRQPEYPDAQNGLGLAFIQLGRFDQALEHLREAVRLGSNNAEFEHNLGAALLNSGKPREAIEHLEKALQIQPQYASAEQNLGHALLRSGQAPQSIAHYQRAVELDPDLAEAHNSLGTVLLDAGRMAEAAEQFRQVARIEPDKSRSYNNLGGALLKAGHAEEAIRALDRAVQISPQYVEAWTSLAAANAQARRDPEAITAANKAIELARAQGNTGLVQQLEAFLTSLHNSQPATMDSPTGPALPPSTP